MIALTYVAEPAVAGVCLAIGVLARIMVAVIGIEMLIIIFNWQFGYFSGPTEELSSRCVGAALHRHSIRGRRRYVVDRRLGWVF
jgi:uncharacterized membrane protein YphA (DoxX/SURF4 family)